MAFDILVLTDLVANTQKQEECQYDFDDYSYYYCIYPSWS